MACNMSATLLVPLVVAVLFVAGAHADASEFPPPPARRAGPVPTPTPPPPAIMSAEKDNCPMIRVPALVDACRSPPGLAGCAAQCIVYKYRGGHCDVLPNGRLGDCTCMNCIGAKQE